MTDTSKTAVAEPQAEAAGGTTLDIVQIQRILPHRYPFLLIDRVLDMTRKQRIVALKNVTVNEPFFQGHFPGFPIMPGVLIIESMAQAGGALLLTEVPDRDGKLMVFTGIERAKFRKPVVPGDVLHLEVVPLRRGSVIWKMRGEAKVGGVLVAEAEFLAGIKDVAGAADTR